MEADVLTLTPDDGAECQAGLPDNSSDKALCRPQPNFLPVHAAHFADYNIMPC